MDSLDEAHRHEVAPAYREATPADRPHQPLQGRGLRFVLVDELRQRGVMRVAEMVTVLDDYGFDLGGRASKVISDALRWEVVRGRVIRVERGVYRFHRASETTVRRIRIFAGRCHAYVVAVKRRQKPPPTPTNRRPGPRPWHERGQDPTRPPWEHLGWLWTV